MRHSISTEIKIETTAEVIWRILSATEDYPDWNPFITRLEGQLTKGSKLSAQIGGMKFKPTVLHAQKNKELKWLGSLLFKGLFDGEHRFQIIENEDSTCTFIQSEKFSGILVGLFRKKLDNETKDGFVAMNEALKQRCED